MSIILEVTEVDQSFRVGFWLRRVQILHDICLTVPERSIFGFLGANGAGKTTLIHLITGLRKPSRGQVRILGHEASSAEAKSRMGYLPERPYFHEHLTGDGLLKYFGALAGLSRAAILSRIPVVLSAVGMKHAQHVELKRYSKGMLQRIGIAQALIHDPEFLVLDEPMSGLDPLGRKEMRELILQLSTEGRTVFFSSHVIPDVEAICDQVALLQKGHLLGCGPMGQFLTQESLQVEITFTGLKMGDVSTWPEFSSAKEIGGEIRAMVAGQEKVDQVLRKLLSETAHILSVSPIRPSLENLFARDDQSEERGSVQ